MRPDSHHYYANAESSEASRALSPGSASSSSMYNRNGTQYQQPFDHAYHSSAHASNPLHRHHIYNQNHSSHPAPTPTPHGHSVAASLHDPAKHYHHPLPGVHSAHLGATPSALHSYAHSTAHPASPSQVNTAPSSTGVSVPMQGSRSATGLGVLMAPSTSSSSSAIASDNSATHGATTDTARVRAYRSRKDRPCDHCRKRKSRCIIERAGQDCQNCQSQGKQCTFEMSPTPRSRPIKNEDGTISSVIVPSKRSHAQRHGSNHSSPSSVHARYSSGGTMTKADDEPHSPFQRKRAISSSTMTAAFDLHSRTESVGSSNAPRQRRRSSQMTTESGSPNDIRSRIRFGSVDEHDHHEEPHQPRATRQSRSTKATSDQLYDFISALMYGEDRDVADKMPLSNAGRPAESAEGEASAGQGIANQKDGDLVSNGEEQNQTRSNEGASEEEKGMMPVALGSSSSEDPRLLLQAGSETASAPAVARTGSDSTTSDASPLNDHMSTSSKTTMPPPPTPESQATAVAAATGGACGPSPSGLRPLQVRTVTSDPHHPVFFAYVPANPYGRKGLAREIGSQELAKVKQALQGRIGRLMVLYSQRDSAAFPLLMESQRRKYRQAASEAVSVPTSTNVPLPDVLSIGTLATATAYDVSLRSTSKQAWGYSLHTLMEQFEISNITTLQVALTDLTGRPSINASGNFMTFNQTLAIGHMLGLHLDPTAWNIAREEKDVRIRLWWATLIHDKWSSLCWGRPSTIHGTDYTTPLPRRNRLSPCHEHLEDKDLPSYKFGTGWQTSPHAHTPGDTFSSLCRLTLILSDVLNEFHSVRPSHKGQRDAYAVAQRINTYFMALEDWKDMQPETLRCVLIGDEEGARNTHSIPGTRSLQLSYLGVNLLLCRTALDSVTTRGVQDPDRIMAAHRAALHSTMMVVEFLESLSEEEYGGFFLHYGSHHLASCLSLLARLSFGFSSLRRDDLLQSCIATMQRLLVVLSEAHRTNKWDLAELTLTRSRAILPTLEARIPGFPRFFSVNDEQASAGASGSTQTQDEQKNASLAQSYVSSIASGFAAAGSLDVGAHKNISTANSLQASSGLDGRAEASAQGNDTTMLLDPVQNGNTLASQHGHGNEQALRPSFQPESQMRNDTQNGKQDSMHPHPFSAQTAKLLSSGGADAAQHPHASGNFPQSMRLQPTVMPHSVMPAGASKTHTNGLGGSGQPDQNFPSSAMLNEFQFMSADGSGAAIPYDAVGVPYPLTNMRANDFGAPAAPNAGVAASLFNGGSTAASHLLSGVEVDWLGIGLQPNTYPDSFLIGQNGANVSL